MQRTRGTATPASKRRTAHHESAVPACVDGWPAIRILDKSGAGRSNSMLDWVSCEPGGPASTIGSIKESEIRP